MSDTTHADLSRSEAYAAVEPLERESNLSNVRVQAGDAGGFYIVADFEAGGMVGTVELHDMTPETREQLTDADPEPAAP